MNKELDLDALLAIVQKRTPGEWNQSTPNGYWVASKTKPGIICQCYEIREETQSSLNAAAIVTAVNNFEVVAERCKRAEDGITAALRFCDTKNKTITELTLQSDELQERCKRAEESLNQASMLMHGRPLLCDDFVDYVRQLLNERHEAQQERAELTRQLEEAQLKAEQYVECIQHDRIIHEQSETIARLARQRDELLAACEAIVNNGAGSESDRWRVIHKAKDAIRFVKGGANG